MNHEDLITTLCGLEASFRADISAIGREMRSSSQGRPEQVGLNLYGALGFGDHYSDFAERLESASRLLDRAQRTYQKAEKVRASILELTP